MDIDTEIASYFINNTTVDDPYQLTPDQSQTLGRKFEIFNQLTAKYPLDLGKKASKSERESLNLIKESSLTYGEIEFQALGEIFYTIQERYGGLPSGGAFYDLGSGTGKALLAAALLGNFSECIGIEILSGLHKISISLIEEYDDEITQHVLQNSSLWITIPKIRSILGDICQEDWKSAAFIFVNSTCFSDEMVEFVSDVEVPVGTLAVSLTRALSARTWVSLETVRKRMSWGEATVYIQRKADPEEQKRLLLEFGKGLDS